MNSSATGITEEATQRGAPGRSPLIKLAVLVMLLAALACWAALGGGELLADVRDRVDSLGFWGPLVFALCYALAVTALLPGPS